MSNPMIADLVARSDRLSAEPRHPNNAGGNTSAKGSEDRMCELVDLFPGVERADEMVAAFGFCRHGRGGAAPAIDTATHGLVDKPHVDHLPPDSGDDIFAGGWGANRAAAALLR